MYRIKEIICKINARFFEDKLLMFVFKESGIAFVLKAISSLVGFLFNIILARMLTPSELGIYFLVFTANNLSSLVSRHGLEKISIRYIASYVLISDYDALGKFYNLCQRIIFAVSLFISISSTFLVIILAKKGLISGDIVLPFTLSLGLGTLPAAMSTIYAQYLKGINLTRSAVLVLSFFRPLFSIPFSVILFYSLGLNGTVLAFVISAYLTWIIGFLFWKKGIKNRKIEESLIQNIDGSFLKSRVSGKSVYKSSTYLLFEAVMQLMIKQSPTFTLGVLSTSDNIGLYNIAFRVSFLIAFFLSSVDFVVSSKYSEFFKLSRLDLVSSLAKKTTLLMCCFMFPMLVILIIFSAQILSLFGDNYVSASTALIILSAGQLVNVATGSSKTILAMSGNERYIFLSTAVSGILSFVLCTIFIPRWGVSGAAMSTAFALILQNIMLIYILQKKLGITTIPFVKN